MRDHSILLNGMTGAELKLRFRLTPTPAATAATAPSFSLRSKPAARPTDPSDSVQESDGR